MIFTHGFRCTLIPIKCRMGKGPWTRYVAMVDSFARFHKPGEGKCDDAKDEEKPPWMMK